MQFILSLLERDMMSDRADDKATLLKTKFEKASVAMRFNHRSAKITS